jgi:hypothetical protein
MPINSNTVWIYDIDTLRKEVAREKEMRGVTFQDIGRETGVNFTQLSTFVGGTSGLGVHGIASLTKWANLDPRTLIVRQRNVTRHSPTPQERDLRMLAGYLKNAGLEVQDGESIVEAAMRLLAESKRTDDDQ